MTWVVVWFQKWLNVKWIEVQFFRRSPRNSNLFRSAIVHSFAMHQLDSIFDLLIKSDRYSYPISCWNLVTSLVTAWHKSSVLWHYWTPWKSLNIDIWFFIQEILFSAGWRRVSRAQYFCHARRHRVQLASPISRANCLGVRIPPCIFKKTLRRVIRGQTIASRFFSPVATFIPSNVDLSSKKNFGPDLQRCLENLIHSRVHLPESLVFRLSFAMMAF